MNNRQAAIFALQKHCEAVTDNSRNSRRLLKKTIVLAAGRRVGRTAAMKAYREAEARCSIPVEHQAQDDFKSVELPSEDELTPSDRQACEYSEGRRQRVLGLIQQARAQDAEDRYWSQRLEKRAYVDAPSETIAKSRGMT